MVQADAPVFIILGVMAVLVGLVPILGFVENFGGSSQGSNNDALNNLANQIDNTCEQLDEYDPVLTSTVELDLSQDSSIELNDDKLNLEGPEEGSITLECEKDIDFSVSGNSNDIIQGSSTASISGEGNTVIVEVEVK